MMLMDYSLNIGFGDSELRQKMMKMGYSQWIEIGNLNDEYEEYELLFILKIVRDIKFFKKKDDVLFYVQIFCY